MDTNIISIRRFILKYVVDQDIVEYENFMQWIYNAMIRHTKPSSVLVLCYNNASRSTLYALLKFLVDYVRSVDIFWTYSLKKYLNDAVSLPLKWTDNVSQHMFLDIIEDRFNNNYETISNQIPIIEKEICNISKTSLIILVNLEDQPGDMFEHSPCYIIDGNAKYDPLCGTDKIERECFYSQVGDKFVEYLERYRSNL
ncbi:MAG: hypothetical protein ACYCPT_08325 [Acidimicrobiales bacterium]